ncbi:tRNA glutamyl-Q(34) synthetase GluQRS [Sneathiella chinensis]|uniref:tRNA glutamyl-Q(34) synthetase GluQRS n=1 Tax=Sneathiella chinensis TaxID=349750 RepID=A0ABQ5U1N0_9PROT|nr:tRNA glutamyl-Q(34) synthetase GluQRS [Sneathiella chinensis]GLQ05331.1 tRNA glutamyl-Q(34) synthetase GluQRS [Sneathiella chinensis]
MKIVTRFAPSPTGYLHVGHAYSASLAWRLAQESDGYFLLRMEDIDQTRCRPEFEAALLEDLAWLGLTWEQPVRRQSEHLDDYAVLVDRLFERDLIYPCFCTRKEIAAEIAQSQSAPHGPDGPVYPGTCKHLSRTEQEDLFATDKPYALRLHMDRALQAVALDSLTFREQEKGWIQCDPARFGDVVLARKETPASYHLAVTFDDAIQGVNLVVRGQDLFEATHIHRLLQALLDLPTPEYRHHGLVTDMKGKRLAKRNNDAMLKTLREQGYTPEEVRKLVGFG